MENKLILVTKNKDTDFYHCLRYASSLQNVCHVPTISIQSFKMLSDLQNL